MTLKNNRKRVVLSVTNDLSYDQRMIRTASSLQNAGYDVILIGRSHDHSMPLEGQTFRQKRIRCWFSKGFLFYKEYTFRMLILLLFTKADIYVAVDLDTILPNRIASGLKRARLVYDAHEYFTEVPELKGRNFVRWIWNSIGKLCVPGADLCYTVSNSLAVELGRKYRKNFHVIMNTPLLSEKDHSPNPDTPKVIVYQGVLNPGRGLEEAISAMHGLNAVLRIIGDGPMRKSLEEMVAREGLHEKVSFSGFLPPKQLEYETRKASIGINLLDSKSLSYYYSLSNKFFNYIHANIPQICADFPEYRAINDQWKVSVTCKSYTEEIKSAIGLLLADQEYYDRLRNNCITAAGKLNWQAEEQKLLALFDKL
jgi:glycosyltransferase involved in cell wall biosynthesis